MNAKANPHSAFTLTLQDDGIGIIEINVPGDAQNTLKEEFADDFSAVFAQLENAPP